MKKLMISVILLTAFLGIQGCSGGESGNSSTSKTNDISTSTPVEVSATATPAEISTIAPAIVNTVNPSQSTKKENIEYTVLSEFRPFNQKTGLGSEIMIKADTTKDEIIELVKRLSKGKDPVAIDIFITKKAYDEYISHKTTNEFKAGYVASYTKNKSFPNEAFYGSNEIVWMQETGSLSSLFNTTTKIDD
ncbi:MAG: hypothetical protein Q8942_10225 [Bacillota bacterium]|nr:hypothetical protein [Bacillota bacterium]